MSDMVSIYMNTPPIARTIATAVFICSVGVYTGMISAQPFVFHYLRLLKFPPALYLFVTSFLLTGPDLGVLFDTYFIFTYLSQLESHNPKFSKKEDMIWYLMFVGSVIILLNSLFTNGMVFLPALLIALCYTATQDQRGMNAHFYVITIPAQLMPYCLLLVQLLFPDGWNKLKIGLTGLLAAHLHDFLSRIYPEFGNGPNLIPTPWFISWIMSTPRTQNTVYGQSMAPPKEGGGRGGPLPDSWRTRGSGRRLG
ncbi:Der1-like family-domain-containing protein [Hypomontagnella monticulosa]|nr:Der1-like family-domain-containing protein [Hypomontagnella monticulosa]